ncbi:immunoglobulin superfamily member 1-like [Mauremys reevesii]|uniref:immunoglobulin superfamily member 1-like n=1 Tax=Mauremys reevesii TaxID=260615 RepID=UPI00193ECEC3|nr:immunoglobulin superfamily member 1-like [Mauremys reevesii]
MASAVTVLLLGCWLAGHSGVWGGREFLKPTIWVSPSRVVALGGNLTIHCEGRQRSMEFFLRKAGHPNPQVRTVPDGNVAEFPITSVGREDGGSYTCDYRSIADQNRSSHPSDPVEIIVGEPSYPKPSISLLSPSEGVSLGAAVTVQCRGQHQGMRFVLNKEGRNFRPVDSDGFQAEFSSSNVHRDLGGSYSCSYHSKSEPFNVSYPSDPVELVVRDPGLPRPSISLNSTGVTAPGANVTIRCEGQRRDVRFFLHKAGDLNPQRHMDPAGARAEFRIPSVGRQHGGSYSCSYRPRSEPFVSSLPSDTVQLVVAEPSYPKPSISLSPSWGVSLGGTVAVRCRGQHQGMRFVLNKEGRHFPPVDSDGFEAEFSSSNVHRDLGGSYSCSYHSRSEPFTVSYPSDPMELVVRDPGLPRPSISLSLTSVTASGADATIRCQGQHLDVRFFLHKAGDRNPQRHMDPAGAGAEFHIPSVGRQHGGSYLLPHPDRHRFYSHRGNRPDSAGNDDSSHPSGLRRARSEPPNWSYPSDIVQIIVAESYYPKPSISLHPSGGVALGGAVTVQCRGRHQNMRFLLYKDGNSNALQDMEPAGDLAEFPIRHVSWRDAGTYSCYYHNKWYLVTWSYPSDPVELVVAGREYPKPTIWVSPSRVVALGGSVTIRCEGWYPGVEFVLRKAGHPNPQVQTVPDGTVAEFPIPSVGREDGGSSGANLYGLEGLKPQEYSRLRALLHQYLELLGFSPAPASELPCLKENSQ